ncbi:MULTISPECIES: class I SAM-dependent methyltransferase [Streptomyces]|uniref:Demethylmenaquinone methyltransferase n=1 Tax=Streptomyces chartreusis NRRL 3882 TaxID=1079985 RepID=A0A2N9BK50_STRCX|nr:MULTISPECIES: class I SAM-dependent methyltransferase [Streptomyces]MYS89185.1 methyltransferase domain-containing protein [Streptomyces sp. SID5464]SOR83744.1 Demethylmenaquinone methyltransferase [Streptomyces chartreusis NRRL 3882]
MDAARRAGDEQAARWKGRAGHAWGDLKGVLDEMFRPFEELLVDAVAAEQARQVLEVGCGTGGITLAVARRLGPAGRCVGIDISEPMISTAREYAEQEAVPASFICDDAQDHAFDPGTFDAVISRFGVMFFRDSVRAFANLRRAARDEAALRFVVWRDPSENPFMTTAQRAAAPLLPELPVPRPDEPGQFAFADPDKVRRILTESGWAAIDIRPVDVVCTLPEKELVRYFTRLGALGMYLPEVDEKTRARVVETVRAAFDPFVHGSEVRFTAACWTVGARASTAKFS